MLPFRFGTEAEFSAARALLSDGGYTARAVCERVGIDEIYEFRTLGEGREGSAEIRDALDLLIHLFLDGLAVPIAAADALLPRDGLGALRALGLLDRHPDDADRYAATVLLYPVEDVYVASDLMTHAPGRARPEDLEPSDHVFSAITSLTGTFLSQLPKTPCDRFLELCAGTGVAALAASSFARQVWALDITGRATAFAEFNARLNGVANLTALEGDLYEPVRGMTFDRIAAHPPYVPSADIRMIFRDGGDDGEQVIRRILGGLVEHLEPGGRFYCTCMATDRDAPLEERIRAMVGEREAELDLLLVTHYVLPPAEYYGRLAASGRITYARAEEADRLFRTLGARRMVYCSFVLQRHADERAPFTLRRERAPQGGRDETEWLMGWRTRLAESDLSEALLESAPRLSPHARLHVTHRAEGGEWKVDECRVAVELPFARTVDVSLNTSILLSMFDGRRPVREILQRIKTGGAVPGEVPEEAFAEFVRELVTEGVLLLPHGEAEHRG